MIFQKCQKYVSIPALSEPFCSSLDVFTWIEMIRYKYDSNVYEINKDVNIHLDVSFWQIK